MIIEEPLAGSSIITASQWRELLHTRAFEPGAIAAAYASRRRRPLLGPSGTLFLVAADHPARGALGAGGDPAAMADRRSLLDRLLIALDNPAVDGVLGTPDIIEELLLLHGLHDKVVIGSMNRGGLAGADWEIDDRFTAYDAQSIVDYRLDGGKMLLRLVNSDAGTAPTLRACAEAVSSLAAAGVMAMVEPLPYERHDGSLVLQDDATSLARAVTIASGIGRTSAHTWLKLPAPADPEAVLGATTLPSLVLGGADADTSLWSDTLRHPVVRGLVVGRTLLYPKDGDVATAVANAAALLRSAREEISA